MIFSDHFKRTLKLIGIGIALLIGAYLYLKHRIHEYKNPAHITLPIKDAELITQNENRHTITITTPKGSKTVYSRNTEIELRKDGAIVVDKHAWGTEFHPILGLGYQDSGRVYLGVDWFYFHEFDVFSALGFPSNPSHVLLEPITGVSWNVYSNTSIGVGINTINLLLEEKPEFGVVLLVRL